MSKNFDVLRRNLEERENVDREALAPSGMVSPGPAKPAGLPPRFRLPSEVSEEYLKLKARIEVAKSNGGVRSLVVTSAHHAEGTTGVAANLAVAYATGGIVDTLLVDAAFHKPGIHRAFGEQRGPGLTDLLSGSGPFADGVRATPIVGLKIVTAGGPVSNPSRLLESDRFKGFQAFARENFDMVIYDASPFLPYSDGRILAAKVDGTLLVIQANRTRIQAAARAKKEMEGLGISVLGTVVNRYRQFVPEFIFERT